MIAILAEPDMPQITKLEKKIKKSCPLIKLVATITKASDVVQAVRLFDPGYLFIDYTIAFEIGNEILIEFYKRGVYTIVLTEKQKVCACMLKIPAFNFLLKSFETTELSRIYNHLFKIHLSTQISNSKIKLAINGSIFFLEKNEIILLKAEGNYTQLFLTENRKFLLSKTLKEVVKELPASNFFRIHNSYCINLAHVIEYRKTDGGMVILSNGECTSISRSKKDDFLQLMF
jgi:two-component system LytT family response regulator